jgi:hypothetical protein
MKAYVNWVINGEKAKARFPELRDLRDDERFVQLNPSQSGRSRRR